MSNYAYNPITGQLDLVGGGASYIDGVVDNSSLLPVTLGTPALDSVFLAKAGSGLWLISRRPAGLYVRVANNGVAADWTYLGAFPEVNADGNWSLYNTSDPTKELGFSLASIGTGTKRIITVPNKNITLDDAGDSRTPSSTLAHKASHATGGTDALAPSDIGAQSIFVTEDLGTITANVTLTAARAKIYTVNTATSGLRMLLPTTGVMAGDVVIIEFNSSTGQTLTPMRGSISSGFFTDNLRPVDRATFIAASTSATSWYEDRTISRFAAEAIFSGTVDVARLPVGTGSTQVAAGNHTHVVADVTGAAASGSITTSGLTQATARILGRTTASTGAVEEIQIGSGLSLSAGELSATGGSGGGEVRSDFVSPYTYTGLADAGTSESTASWTIRRSEFDAGGSFVATLTASAVQWANRLTASYS